MHILNKAKAHDVNIADSKECSSADLFIAAPINNDPICISSNSNRGNDSL